MITRVLASNVMYITKKQDCYLIGMSNGKVWVCESYKFSENKLFIDLILKGKSE